MVIFKMYRFTFSSEYFSNLRTTVNKFVLIIEIMKHKYIFYKFHGNYFFKKKERNCLKRFKKKEDL